MSRRILLLNSTYECISFVTYRKAIKLIVKEKVDVLSSWNDNVRWGSGKSKYPATLRMRYYVPRFFKRRRCNRMGILRRDQYTCQYCGVTRSPNDLTIDHIKPRAMGGITTWENCVAACFDCNNKKADRALKHSGLKLMRQPKVPLVTVKHEYNLMREKHEDWNNYII